MSNIIPESTNSTSERQIRGALRMARLWVAREAARAPTQPTGIDRARAARADLDVIDAALGVATGEEKLLASRAADPDAKPDGTLEALETCANMLETYMPECMPANEHGQVDFVRCMTDATVSEIRAYIANTRAGTAE